MFPIFQQYNLDSVARFDTRRLTAVRLFEMEEMRGVMLCFEPGQEIPLHTHANEHEVFDVIHGHGAMLIGDMSVRTGPGKTVFVPAGTPHAFLNDGDERWVVRATVLQRTYPRHLGRLLGRAVRKRLGLAPR